MMEVWRKVRLGDACVTNADSYSSKEEWKFVNYLDTGNITDNRIDSIQYIDVANDKLPSRAKRKVRKNSIIYSTVRPNQRHFGIIKTQPENFLVSTGFAVIDVDAEMLDADFLYYLLTQPTLVEALHAIAEQSTSAYPSIKPSDIEDLDFGIAETDDQLGGGADFELGNGDDFAMEGEFEIPGFSDVETAKEEKKSKKYKLINSPNKPNKSFKKQNSRYIQNTFKRENKKNLTSHKHKPKTENVSRIRNYSFNQKKRPSIFLRKKISIINQKQVVNIQKSIMNTNLNNFNYYKTLDQVFKEIKFQESKLNTDSYSGFGNGLIKLSNKIEKEHDDMEKIFKKGEKKRKTMSFGKEYLRRIANSRNDKPVFNKEESESSSLV